MNPKKEYHGPDIEDSSYLEEDYLDKDSRKDYEKKIVEIEGKFLEKIHPHKNIHDNIKSKTENSDLRDKVNDLVNDATILL